MTPLDSKQIILLLNTQLSDVEPIESQLKKLFTIWRGTVVSRTSWRGRLASWITHPSEASAIQRKICQAYAQVLLTAPEAKAKYQKNTLQFLKWTRENRLSPMIPVVQDALHGAPEIEELRKAVVEVKEELVRPKISEGSLLLNDSPNPQAGSGEESLKKIFELSKSNELTVEDLDFIRRFLEKHPESAAEGWEKRFDQMKANFEKVGHLAGSLIKGTEGQRSEILQKEAEELFHKVKELKFEDEGCLHLQRYGSRVQLNEKISRILAELPSQVLENIPEGFRKAIFEGKSIEPHQMAQFLFESFYSGEGSDQPFVVGQNLLGSRLRFLSALLPDEHRLVEGRGVELLPDIFRYYLEQMARSGVLLSGVGLVGSLRAQQICEWLAVNGAEIIDNPENLAMKNLFISKIEELLVTVEEPIKATVNGFLGSSFENIGKNIPGVVLEFSETEDLFLQGDIWFEFRKQRDGKYTLSLYTTGQGVNYHPAMREEGMRKFCFKLENIEEAHLNLQFFESLIQRNWESLWNKDFSSTARDVYHTILPPLKGTPAKDELTRIRKSKLFKVSSGQFESDVEMTTDPLQLIGMQAAEKHSSFATVMHLLMKKEDQQSHLIFDFLWTHFINYCQVNCVEGEYVEIDEAKREILEPLLKSVKERFASVKNLPAYSKKAEVIEKTLNDLSAALDYQAKLASKEGILSSLLQNTEKKIQDKLKDLGLTSTKLLQFEAMFEWFLGEGVEPILHPFVSELTKMLPEEVNVDSKEKTENKPAQSGSGVVKGTYATLYLDFGWKIAKLLMLASGFVAGGAWTALSIPSLLSLLPYVLPEKQYQYYCEAMVALRYAMAKMLFQVSWNYLFTKKTKQNFLTLQRLIFDRMSILNSPEKLFSEFSLGRKLTIDPQPVPVPIPRTPKAETKLVAINLNENGAVDYSVKLRWREKLLIPDMLGLHLTNCKGDPESVEKLFSLIVSNPLKEQLSSWKGDFDSSEAVKNLYALRCIIKVNSDKPKHRVAMLYLTELMKHVVSMDSFTRVKDPVAKSFYRTAYKEDIDWAKSFFETASKVDSKWAQIPLLDKNVIRQMLGYEQNGSDAMKGFEQFFMDTSGQSHDSQKEEEDKKVEEFSNIITLFYERSKNENKSLIDPIDDTTVHDKGVDKECSFVPRLPRPALIADLEGRMDQIINLATQGEPIYELIRTLPLPCEGSEWDKIENLEGAIAKLQRIIKIEEINTQLSARANQVNRLVKLMLSSYRIVAILIPLVRKKLNSWESEFGVKHLLQPDTPIDFYDLLTWSYNKSNCLTDPKDNEELETLLRHLLPHINLENPPNNDEIEKLKSESIDPHPSSKFRKEFDIRVSAAERLLKNGSENDSDVELPPNFSEGHNYTASLFIRLTMARTFARRSEEAASLTPLDRHGYPELSDEACPAHLNPLLGRRRQHEIIEKPDFNKAGDSETVGVEASEMVSAIIAHYTKYPLVFHPGADGSSEMYNRFASVFFRPGCLKQALEYNPTLVDALCEMLQLNFDSQTNSVGHLLRLHWNRNFVSLAQSLENYCERYLPGSRPKFQFIDRWIARIKQKPHIDLFVPKLIVQMELERIPQDPAAVAGEKEMRNCLRVLLSAMIFHDIDMGDERWAQWLLQIAGLFQNRDKTLRDQVLIELYKEQGFPEDEAIQLIDEFEFSIDKKNLLKIKGKSRSIEALKLPWKQHEYLQTILDVDSFGALVFVDRYTFRSEDSTNFYHIRFKEDRFVQGGVGFEIIREVQNGQGSSSYFRYFPIFTRDISSIIYGLIISAEESGSQRKGTKLKYETERAWVEVFDSDCETIERNRKRRLLISAQNDLGVRTKEIMLYGTIEELATQIYGISLEDYEKKWNPNIPGDNLDDMGYVHDHIGNNLDLNHGEFGSYGDQSTQAPFSVIKSGFKGIYNKFTGQGPEKQFKRMTIDPVTEALNGAARLPTSIPIDSKAALESALKPLAHFCSIDDTNISAEEVTGKLKGFGFIPYQLNFNLVENLSGDLLAEAAQFPGYFIAKLQYHATIAGIPNTLLLESHAGKKKVLVSARKSFLNLAAVWTRLDAISGPLVKSLLEKIAAKFKTEGVQEYYAFDIEVDEAGKSKLVSSDQRGLAYLLIHHLYRLDYEAAEEQCKEIERLYRHQPIPADFWPEINYLLVPSVIPEMAQYRWRVISARMMNKRLHPIEDAKNSQKDINEGILPKAMNLMVLLDLIAFMDKADVRSYLSEEQEYFLYQYLISTGLEVIKDKLPHSDRFSFFLNRDFIETLFEFSPFAQMPLVQRYGQLKRDLAKEPIGRGQKIYKWVCRFLNAPSDLPEYHGTVDGYIPQPTLQDNSVVKGAVNLRKIRSLAQQQSFVFDAQKLLKEISRWEFCKIRVDFEHFKIQSVKSHFIYYYALLRADQVSNIDPEGLFREQLKQSLLRNKGLGDKTTQRLTEILIQLSKLPEAYPQTLELSEAHERGLDGTEESTKKWEQFVYNLYERVLMQELCCTILAPVLGWSMMKLPSDNLVGGLFSPLMTSGDSMADTIRKLSVGRAKTHFSTLLTGATQKYIDRITLQVVGKIRQSNPKHIAIGAGAAAMTTYAASWMVGNMLATTVDSQVEQYKDEYESTTTQWMQTLAPLVPIAVVTANAAFAYFRKKSITASDVLPLSYVSGLKMTTKIGRTVHSAYKEQQQMAAKNVEPIKFAEHSLAELQRQEEMIDAFMTGLFDLAFTEEPVPDHDAQQVKIELLDETKAKTPFEEERLKRVNDSIREFYKRKADNGKTLFKLKPNPLLELIFCELQLFQNVLMAAVADEKSKLEDVLKMSFTRIEKCIDDKYARPFDEKTGLRDQDRPLIKLVLARIYMKVSRIKQIQELLKLADEFSRVSISSNPAHYYYLANKLATGLKVKTEYDLATTAPRLAYMSAQFEAATGKKLWPRQAEKLALTQTEDIVLDLPPGDGKTAAIIPITIAEKADGEHLVMPIFPKQLAGDNMRTVNMQSHQIFNRVTYRFKFNRELVLTNETLEDLRVIVNGAVRNGEAIQMTKEDAQALRSIFVERLYDYTQTSKGIVGKIREKVSLSKDEAKRGLILLHGILKVIFTKGIAIADETHETYAHRKQLNYPIGNAVSLNEEYARMIEAVFREAMNCPELLNAFLENEACFFDSDTYEKVHKKTIAKALSNWKLLKIPGEDEAEIAGRKEEFVKFTCEELDYIPRWMTKDISLFRRISLIKGLLNDLLPRSFKSRSGVNFGRKEGDKTECARPSDGNNGASTTDSIKNPFEAYVKTILMLLDRGLNEEQFTRMSKKLKRLAKREMDVDKIRFEQTSIHRQFPDVTLDFLNSKDKSLKQAVYQKLRKNPQLCLLYTRTFIRQEITYWQLNIENNSQDFASMFAKQISCTGTPYNDGTYPAWMTMLRDPTTIGELLDIIARKCKGVEILQAAKPRAILKELIEAYFKKGSNFSALIDGGALMTGLSNREVAEAMFEYCKDNRADEIFAVKFYMEDAHGSEQLFCLTKNGDGPIPATQVSIPPENCLTYYDQRHGFGADVKQEGDGLETMGPNHPLFKWLQELFRIRGLKNDARLIPWAQDLVKENKIQIVMTQEVQKLILNEKVPNRIPTLTEIVEYAVRNEAATAEEENYPSLLSKIRQVPSKAIYGKMMKTASENFDDWYPLFQEFQSLFISKVQDDPAQLFGHVKKEVDVQNALKAAHIRNMKLIESSSLISVSESTVIKNEIKALPKPVLKEKVMVAVGPDGMINEEASLEMGFEQTVELSVDQKDQVEQNEEAEQEQEQDQDLNQELNVNSQHRQHKNYHYRELSWPADFDPTAIGSFPFVASGKEKRNYWSNGKTTCPIFTVKSLLAEAKNPLLRMCDRYFDRRLWMSNNFVPRHVKGVSETTVDIADRYQLPLTHVIVHFEMDNEQPRILNIGALSVHEAAFMKKKYLKAQKDWSSKRVKTVIWNCDLNLQEAGNNSYSHYLKKSEEFLTLLAQLKLLDGQIDFREDAPFLLKWLRTHNESRLFDAIEAIVANRGRVFKGSQLDKICRQADTSFSLMDLM